MLPSKYTELKQITPLTIPAVLRLPGAQDLSQGIQFQGPNGSVIAAFNDLLPYGERTEESIQDDVTDLLKTDYQGEDYSLYTLPKDMLPLVGLSLGTGYAKYERLKPIYEFAGQVIGKLSNSYDMKQFDIANIGFLRKNNQIIVLPPYHFQHGPSDKSNIKQNLKNSVAENLSPLFSTKRIAALARALLHGMENETAS